MQACRILYAFWMDSTYSAFAVANWSSAMSSRCGRTYTVSSGGRMVERNLGHARTHDTVCQHGSGQGQGRR